MVASVNDAHGIPILGGLVIGAGLAVLPVPAGAWSGQQLSRYSG
jgi:hypothetical protein